MNNRIFGLVIRSFGLLLNFVLLFYIGEKYKASFSSDFFTNISFLMFIALIGRFGLEDIILKLSVFDYKNHNNSFLKYALSKAPFLLFINLILSSITVFFDFINAPFIIIFLFVFLYNLNILCFSYLNGINELFSASLPLFVLSPMLIYSCIFFGQINGWEELLIVYIYSFIISLLLFVFFINRNYIKSPLISFKNEISSNTLPIAVSSISAGVATYLSIYILSFKLDSQDLILWTYSLKIIQLLSVLVLLLNIYFAPIYRNFFINNKFSSIRRKFNLQVKYSAFLIIPYVIFIPYLYNLFIGDSNSQSVKFVDIFYILVVGYGISFILSSIGTLFIMINKQKINALLGLIFSILLVCALYFSNNNQIIYYSFVLSICTALPKIILYVIYKKSPIFNTKK